jgi:hypothetical protein
MRKNILLIGLLSILGGAAVVLAAETASVAGNWTVTFTTPRGERTSTLVIVQDGEKLTVTREGERGDATGSGTIAGNAVEWSFTRETRRGTMTVSYKGSVDGDTMTGEVDMHGRSVPWKAVRAK